VGRKILKFIVSMIISFIIVNHKSEQLLKRCIESIFEHAPLPSYEIIVVNNDNSSLVNPFDNNPCIKIINASENRGFASACNLGAKEATGEVLFFLNADTEFLTSNVECVVQKLNDPMIGIVAPKLILPNGKSQSWSVGYDITLWDTIKNNFGCIKSRHLWETAATTDVDWVSGAAFAISKKFFTECNGFDEKFFMYFEDVDLCKRVRRLNKKIMLLPELRVLHIGGQSQSSTQKQKFYYYESQDYYFKKHFGSISASALKILRSLALFFNRS
jgi:GT2 family glycosyltransferase